VSDFNKSKPGGTITAPWKAGYVANVVLVNQELESFLADLKNNYWTFFNLDWSQDPSRRTVLTGLFAETFGEDIFPEAWLLANVVTHKDYQRRGIGGRLVKWGIDQAESERVPCGVESSFAGMRLYEKVGFRKFENLRYGEKERETMAVMVWEPTGLEGHWFNRAKAAGDAKGREEPSRLLT
jgi:GNAT superfamily N-acetyltransferase